MEKDKTVEPENASSIFRILSPTSDHQTDENEGTRTTVVNASDDRHVANFAAWSTVVSAFLIQLSGFGYANAFGVFQDFYVREYLTKSTSSQISWIGSTQTFLMLTLGFATGRLFDKGHCYHLVIGGSIILILSLFMLSLAKPEQYYQVLLSQGFGVGIGAGLSYAPSVAVLAQHFPTPHARARTMGIAVAGSSIGGLIHPILVNQLLHKEDGVEADGLRRRFMHATLASAGLTAGLLVISVMLLRTRYPKRIEARAVEDSIGEKYTQDGKSTDIRQLILKFAMDWPYVYFVIGMTLFEMVFFFPAFYLQLYSIKHGLNSTFAFYSLSILNGSSFLGRLIPGFFARQLGVTNMFLFSTASCAVLIFCMLAVKSVVGVAVFAALYGFFSGAFITLMGPLLVLLAESQSEVGARMGMCFAMTGIGSLTGTPIAGALLTSKFIWWRPIVFGGVVCVVGLVLFIACRVILGKRKGSLWII